MGLKWTGSVFNDSHTAHHPIDLSHTRLHKLMNSSSSLQEFWVDSRTNIVYSNNGEVVGMSSHFKNVEIEHRSDNGMVVVNFSKTNELPSDTELEYAMTYIDLCACNNFSVHGVFILHVEARNSSQFLAFCHKLSYWKPTTTHFRTLSVRSKRFSFDYYTLVDISNLTAHVFDEIFIPCDPVQTVDMVNKLSTSHKSTIFRLYMNKHTKVYVSSDNAHSLPIDADVSFTSYGTETHAKKYPGKCVLDFHQRAMECAFTTVNEETWVKSCTRHPLNRDLHVAAATIVLCGIK